MYVGAYVEEEKSDIASSGEEGQPVGGKRKSETCIKSHLIETSD
jgi:hypothetical protein